MPTIRIPMGRTQLGVIGRAHGVRGLVKVTSHTADPADLTAYGPLSDTEGRLYTLRWKADGVAEVSRIVDDVPVRVIDRAQAEKLTNTKLFIDRSALPPAGDDEYYLTDLINLAVVDTAGGAVGTVSVVHDYGAGASLEVVGSGAPLLIPFTAACVPTVDIAGGRLTVVLPDEIVVPTDVDVVAPTDVDVVAPTDADVVVPTDGDRVVSTGADRVVPTDAHGAVPTDAKVIPPPRAEDAAA